MKFLVFVFGFAAMLLKHTHTRCNDHGPETRLYVVFMKDETTC